MSLLLSCTLPPEHPLGALALVAAMDIGIRWTGRHREGGASIGAQVTSIRFRLSVGVALHEVRLPASRVGVTVAEALWNHMASAARIVHGTRPRQRWWWGPLGCRPQRD